MRFFGFCALALPGETCRRITEIGKIHTDAFVAGGIRGIWESLLEKLVDDPDFEWLMIDASHIKAHPHASGAKGGNRDMDRTRGGSTSFIWPWMRMGFRSEFL